MYKLLIATPNLTNTKKLINDVIGKVSTLKIVGITTSKKDVLKNKEFVDFVLFHECEYDYQSIIENFSGIICIGGFKTPVKKYEKRLSLSNKLSNDLMIEEIEKFTQKITLNDIRKKAVEILLSLGFNFKHVGTKYLADAIYYSYAHIDCDSFENLEKEIYPYIAKINNTHVENVKWSVTRTINLMYLNHTTKTIKHLEDYFYLERFQKPTPKRVIGTITNNLLP